MQNHKTTIGFEWLFQRMDYLLTWGFHSCLVSFGNRLACHCDTIPMQISTFQETLHQKWDATGCMHICRHIFAKRLDICNKRYARTNGIEVVNLQVDISFACQSQKMEHRIG